MIHKENNQIGQFSKQIKCDECGKRFSLTSDLKQHTISKHKNKISKENWLKREIVLLSKIGRQTTKLKHDIATLEVSEEKKKKYM